MGSTFINPSQFLTHEQERTLSRAQGEYSNRRIISFVGLFQHLVQDLSLTTRGIGEGEQEEDLLFILAFAPPLQG